MWFFREMKTGLADDFSSLPDLLLTLMLLLSAGGIAWLALHLPAPAKALLLAYVLLP